jgi:hypothetical protein
VFRQKLERSVSEHDGLLTKKPLPPKLRMNAMEPLPNNGIKRGEFLFRYVISFISSPKSSFHVPKSLI